MIIFDLDGTLALIEHRRHFVDFRGTWYWNEETRLYHCLDNNIKKKKLLDWDSFFEACDQDDINEPIAQIFHDLHRCERKVQIWSGRSESVREKTCKWLVDKLNVHFCSGFCLEDDLKMRPIKDSTPDDKLKEKWLDEYIESTKWPDLSKMECGKTYHRKDAIEMVFDDRQKVVDMWRRRGITCLQVAPGNF